MAGLITTFSKVRPFPFRGVDIFFVSFKLRNGRRLLREDVCVLCPKEASQHGGMRSHSKIQADCAGNDKKDNEACEDQTTFAQTAGLTFLTRRRPFDPSVHFG